MKAKLVAVFILALIFVAGYWLGNGERFLVLAQSQSSVHYTVPTSYGHCVGYVNHKGGDGLIFEASDGTIHVVNLDSGNAVVIPRQ